VRNEDLASKYRKEFSAFVNAIDIQQMTYNKLLNRLNDQGKLNSIYNNVKSM